MSINVKQILGTLPRSGSQVVRVALAEFNGLPRLDIRVWYRRGKEYVPGTPGICVPVAQLKLLHKALEAADRTQSGATS